MNRKIKILLAACFAAVIFAEITIVPAQTVVRASGSDRVASAEDPVYIVDGRIIDKEVLRHISASDVKDIHILEVPQSVEVCGPEARYGAVLISLHPGRRIDESRIASRRLDRELSKIFKTPKESNICK